MSGFRLKINRLRNAPYSSSVRETSLFGRPFGVEYFFNGAGNPVVVKPILLNTVVIFLIHFPAGTEDDFMALVYNKKDVWSDIEKESTGLAEAIGSAIEAYYSNFYLPWPGSSHPIPGNSEMTGDDHGLN
jgi:hypothetical protein